MNADLLRQRRNLILISGVLLLFDFADVTITKVSILGTELLIGNASVLIYFAWVMWGYFLLRYYQYLMAEKDLGISANIRSGFENRAKAHVLEKLKIRHLSGSIDIKRNGLRWRYAVNEYNQEQGKVREIENGSLPQLRALVWMAASLRYVTIHTPKATDHILPFILAVAAPVVSMLDALRHMHGV